MGLDDSNQEAMRSVGRLMGDKSDLDGGMFVFWVLMKQRRREKCEPSSGTIIFGGFVDCGSIIKTFSVIGKERLRSAFLGALLAGSEQGATFLLPVGSFCCPSAT